MKVRKNDQITRLIRLKTKRKKIVVLTSYDAPSAALLENLGVDMILVGDSVGTVLLGYSSTTEVSMDEMIHHSKAVRRGAPRTLIVGDLPLKGRSYGLTQAKKSARRFIREGGCDAVKIEWNRDTDRLTRSLVEEGIPVMGHVGLTPQTADRLGGLTVQGKTARRAYEIYGAAKTFESLGAFSIVLECVPQPLAKVITQDVSIPTIGIGAGPDCDGQVLVLHDVLGLLPDFKPRFVKHYGRLHNVQRKSLGKFIQDVRSNRFPSKKHCYRMQRAEFKAFLALYRSSKAHHR